VEVDLADLADLEQVVVEQVLQIKDEMVVEVLVVEVEPIQQEVLADQHVMMLIQEMVVMD
jgi:hypothetical protein